MELARVFHELAAHRHRRGAHDFIQDILHTPVLATRRGSVPEVVDYGKTGFYAESPGDLPHLMSSTLTLDRKVLWEHAHGRFSHIRMVDDYVELYLQLANDFVHNRRAK